MADAKTIGISSLIALGLVLAAQITPTFFDKPKYFCESRIELGTIECDSLTKYGVDNGKCVRTGTTSLICKTGWSLVTNDYVFPEEKENITEVVVPNVINYEVIIYDDLIREESNCNVNGCIRKVKIKR